MREIVGLVVFLALTAAAASFGAMFRPGAWYEVLAKPAWTPPNWLFGPVWTVLYIMIAIAGWLVWRVHPSGRPIAIWAVALILNALWSWLFFGRQQIGLALVDIVLLWLGILAFVVAAWPRSRLAALLFVPYLAWVGYATALNAAIWRLN
jgi:tryptophan-rich sensory protein